ncbi:CAP domain-containing protein [candidate division WOR-3 bacterium]|nr:CAP domain-containing protein [candidate division WOR-3 bacterium]
MKSYASLLFFVFVSRLNSQNFLYDLEKRTLDLVNEYRVAHGLMELQFDETVAQQCREHSRFMSASDRGLTHEGFKDRVEKISAVVVLSSAAENVASNLNTPDPCSTAVAGWIGSPPHEKNMSGDWDITGVGVSMAPDGKYYFTQIFVRLEDTTFSSGYSQEEVEGYLAEMIDEYRRGLGSGGLPWDQTIDSLVEITANSFSANLSEKGELLSELNEKIQKYFDTERIGVIITSNSGFLIPHEEIFGDWSSNSEYKTLMADDFDLAGLTVISDDGGHYVCILALVKLAE